MASPGYRLFAKLCLRGMFTSSSADAIGDRRA
jgi:hypothetical protein